MLDPWIVYQGLSRNNSSMREGNNQHQDLTYAQLRNVKSGIQDPKAFKVLITTSGVGSRLGELTNYTNKSLVKVGDKLALSHIVEVYPENTDYIITLGHFGDHVRDFLLVAYPERKFTFVTVKNYKGTGSSLGLSMLLASELLQEPFIFHASDTLILDQKINSSPNENWVAGSKGYSASQYASFDVNSNFVMKFHDKGMMEFDYLHIGLIGIFDYKLFWETLKDTYEKNPLDSSLNDLTILCEMKNSGVNFRFKEIKVWADMGNTESLLSARKLVGEKYDVLEKSDESISFVNTSVIKFFANHEIAENRVIRSQSLVGLVPEITASKGNFYKYGFANGELASSLMTAENFKVLLNWSKENLWVESRDLDTKEFHEICNMFYKSKTLGRVEKFMKNSRFEETYSTINNLKIPSIYELLESIDYEWLSNGTQTKFHGDFILDNIIQTEEGFKLIDWRQDFGGNLNSGDMYYDLAKLNHSLVVNHEIVNQNLFKIEINENVIRCEILRKHELVECKEILNQFLEANGLDVQKIEILTSLIWLNMAPLHHHPLDLFLFNFGKLNLWRAIQGDAQSK
jgi:NDP-sugar pyrophosphorylase family protein